MDSILLILFVIYTASVIWLYFHDHWDPFYTKRIYMQKFLSRREYLEGEIKKLEQELDKVKASSLKDKELLIEEIEKDIKFRKDDLKSFYN